MVLDVDTANRRISLGLKQAEPNPWELVCINHPVGSRINGQVKNITDFGVFIGVEEGIEGLIHVSQLSTERVEKPQSMFTPGQEIEAEVTAVDARDRKIALSIKALRKSEEREEIESYLQREREGGRFSFEDILRSDLRLDRDEPNAAPKPETDESK